MGNSEVLNKIISNKEASALQVGYSSPKSDFICSLGDAEDNSLFDIASVTKVLLTVNLLMRSVQEGKLTLTDECGLFFSDLSEEKKRLTLVDLLTHTSGLRAWIPFYFYPNDSWIEQVNRYPLESKKGEKRTYSDVGFILIGKILEKVWEKPLDRIFNDKLLRPLSLQNTFFEHTCPEKRVVATSLGNPFEKNLALKLGYQEPLGFSWRTHRLKGEVNDFNCHQFFKGVSGHCGLFSNVEDILVLSKDLMKQEQFKLFSEHCVCMNSLGFLNEESLLYFKFSEFSVGHHGFTGCSLILDASTEEVLVYLSNRQFYGLKDNKYPNWKNHLKDLPSYIVPE